MSRRHLLMAGAAAFAAPALAQSDWPNRPVRVIVPYPPAGGADTTARILYTKLGELWGRQFVIDNRGGAGGTIGESVVAKADADGYTILHDGTAFSINPALYGNLPFSYAKDFAPVFLATLVPNILVVNNGAPEKTLSEVIETAKKAPGGLDFASSGNGTLQHLCLEMFARRIGAKLNHIPYRGGGPALNDVVGGQIKYFFSNGSASIGLVTGGRLRAIAHTGKGRLGTLPGLPAAQDTLPGFEAYEWNGVFVPAGTPAAIIGKLNAGLNEVLRQADVQARLKALNIEYRANTSEEFRAFVAAETEKWDKVVREAGIKLGG